MMVKNSDRLAAISSSEELAPLRQLVVMPAILVIRRWAWATRTLCNLP